MIKQVKYIKQKLTTGHTLTGISLVPDLNVSYNVKILLTSNNKDLGCYDNYESSLNTGINITQHQITLTGECSSRLYELKKYRDTGNIANDYFISTNKSDGLVLSECNVDLPIKKYVYYINSIKYYEYSGSSSNRVTFNYVGVKTYSEFDNKPVYKNPGRESIYGKEKISDDVFIVRPEFSVYADYYKLRGIKRMDNIYDYTRTEQIHIKHIK